MNSNPPRSFISGGGRPHNGPHPSMQQQLGDARTPTAPHAQSSRKKRSKSPHTRKENALTAPALATGPQIQPREDSFWKRRKSTHSTRAPDDRARDITQTKKLKELTIGEPDEDQVSFKRGRSRSRSGSRSQSQERRRSHSRKRGNLNNGGALANVVLGAQKSQPSNMATAPKPAGDKVSEKARLREQLKACYHQIEQLKKALDGHEQTIQDLRVTGKQAEKTGLDKDKKIAKLTTAQEKSDELVKNLETQLTCQICLEVLVKPQGLSCGHVLCLACLQSWFTAPKPDDMETDDDFPDNALYRRKSCPCCRATIHQRPMPLFILKSITSLLPNAAPRDPTPQPDENPWAGIFPDFDSADEWDEDDVYDGFGDAEGGDFSSDGMDEDEEDAIDHGLHPESDTDSDDDAVDDDDYTGPYVAPTWEPAGTPIDIEDPYYDDATPQDLRMVRRGATFEMIDTYEMTYSHSRGLCIRVGGDTIYPGWNLALADEDDDGSDFVQWCLDDADSRPERWQTSRRHNGRSLRRLIPQYETLIYEDSASEY